jgi:hypothetical protein
MPKRKPHKVSLTFTLSWTKAEAARHRLGHLKVNNITKDDPFYFTLDEYLEALSDEQNYEDFLDGGGSNDLSLYARFTNKLAYFAFVADQF